GKQVKVFGNLEAYFSQPGIKSLTGYWMDGTGIIPGTGSVTFFEETFATSMGAFTEKSVIGAQIWIWDTYKYMKMSGFANSVNNQNEDWLISPAINLSSAASAFLSFDHTMKFGDLANMQSNHTVWVSNNYTAGAPSTATWEKITVITYPTGIDWVFLNSGKCTIPTIYLGQTNVRIAFKYLCSNTESATWEVKNVKVTSE
ncbi:MAG: choice-of-anchor J domain-containing protein, partial [Bacteroidales bacterium]|nr:choice-of-anchor J domain-containing protein [Bacteroidales bacterium]